MKIAAIAGSLTPLSKTLLTVKETVRHIKQSHSEVDVNLIDLKNYHLDFCDGRDPSEYQGDSKRLIEEVVQADALIVGTPIYRGSIPGALKNVFDLIPNTALRGKVLAFIATGGTYHHYLAIEHQLKPLAGYFKAYTLPGNVYAHNDHFVNKQLADETIKERLHQLGDSVVTVSRKLNGNVIGAEQPVIPRQSLSQT
ncbi:NADPH-dependent FMN reductase [Gracilibacillus kekensis]|uniref:FMN reductase n=1 Tax=Gracilibacillus kekensis TaxID=1027249 RepID=A0A1M7QIS0_9BACI|nr:NADPH-dependent FMN reductase [Gracilibacillus kekensis]SHN30999.1 FMN reductase [Gracilibacillus kekensis]